MIANSRERFLWHQLLTCVTTFSTKFMYKCTVHKLISFQCIATASGQNEIFAKNSMSYVI